MSETPFDWKKSLQQNYLVVAIGLLISGATGAFAAYGYLQQFLQSQFDHLVNERGLIDSAQIKKHEVPIGTVAHFTTACPPGWAAFTVAEGRYIVSGDHKDERRFGLVVGQRLSPEENRPAGAHTHGYVVDEHQNRQGAVQMEFRSPGGGHMPVVPKQTDQGNGLTSGTIAPYIILNSCIKSQT